MRAVATYPDLSSAELAKSILEARDIPAVIPDANLAGLDWRLGTALGGVRLQVEDQHFGAAMELLGAGECRTEELGDATDGVDEICPHCKSMHVGPDKQRRLKILTLLFFPLALVTVPLILLSRGKLRCASCDKTWRPA